MNLLRYLPLLLLCCPAWSAPILNGELADQDNWLHRQLRAYSVRLEITDLAGRSGLCSGVVVSDKVVLTAAHCTNKAWSVKAITGSGKEFKAIGTAYFTKSDAAGLYFQDVLEGGLPAPYVENLKLSAREPFVLSGFGIRATDGSSGDLRYTVKKLLAADATQFVFNPLEGGQICFGDSGGGVFVARGEQLYLVGVNSAVWNGCIGVDFIQRMTAFAHERIVLKRLY